MSFKENLLKKIKVDTLAHTVMHSFGPPDSGLRIDKDAMRSLLEMSPYRHQKERDLDLYVKIENAAQSRILVLDNELPIYRTTIEDVAMRKSPFIKEMVSIRKIVKILNDSDVKISRKEESVKTIQNECIGLLDLSFNESDIAHIAKEGATSLQNGYADGVSESLMLLAELLDFRPPPRAFGMRHCKIFGALSEKKAGESVYGPIVIFSLMDNSLKLINTPISSLDMDKLEFFRQVAQGNEKADIEGKDIFLHLEKLILKKKSEG